MIAKFRTKVLLAPFAGLAVACSSGGGSGPAPVPPTLVFAAPQLTPTGGANGRALVVADFDHDGIADALVANETFASVSLLRGRADGSLASGTLVPAPALVASVAVGDVDGDRVLDVVAASGASTEAMVLRGLGGGAFASPMPLVLPWSARRIQLIDWTGDGLVDLVAASGQTAEVAMLTGNGAGGFGGARIAGLAFAPADFAVVDSNGDQRPDLVCVGVGAQRIDTLRNDGAGGFLPAVVSAVPGLGGKLVASDLNGDRLVDLVVLNAASSAALVCRGDGAGSFVLAGERSLAAAPTNSLALADLDGDGKVDLIAAAGGQLLGSYGDGAGGFAPVELLHNEGLGATWIAAADVVGDGTVDVIYVAGSDRLGMLRNPRSAPTGLRGYGEGTPDCLGRIAMSANGSPRIGNASFGYRTTNAPAAAIGLLLQGGPADVVGSDPLGIGVRMHIAFGLVTSRLVFSNQLGECFMPEPVPTAPGLVGLPIYVQTLWQADLSRTCSTSAGGLVSSAGLTSTIQP